MWLKIGLWAVGGLLAVGAARKVIQAKSGNAAPANSAPTSQSVMPLFMSGSGGLASTQMGTYDLPLGGEVWSTGDVPLSENPDVAIANINKEVALAQIAAQQDIAKYGFDFLMPRMGSGGLTGNGDGIQLPPLRSEPLKPKLSTERAIEELQFIKKDTSKSSTQKGLKILGEARTRGYTADETARLLNKSGFGDGKVFTGASVQRFAFEQGENLLPGNSNIKGMRRDGRR